MRRKAWGFLRRKEVSDQLDYAVKSAWYKFAPVDGIFKFASAFWNRNPKVSNRVEIEDSYTEANEYIELVDKSITDSGHLDSYSRKGYWLHSDKENSYTKTPLSFQVRKYHTSSVNFRRWKEEDIDDEGDLVVSEGVKEAKAFKFTIGSSDFSKLRFGDDYVDKSEFIVAL